jgi:FkbM family methyltransferase
MDNLNEFRRWFADRGDYTHNITYDLNENSIIMDLGGYTGVWANQMIDKYNPNVYILEPIPDFYNIMTEKFKNNNKVHLYNVGISSKNKKGQIFLNGDATSSNIKNGKAVDVIFKDMGTILNELSLNEVDLLQIINKFKNIQVQFHKTIDNAVEKRNNIREGFKKNNFELKFDYPFVWESWTRNK